jgi:hypothetical protein
MDKTHIINSILSSQHCQRNWDLTKNFDQDHIDIFIQALTQCPSKQNASFYKVHLVFDREIIEKIHATTHGFGITPSLITTNTQTLANMLIVFESANSEQQLDRYRNNYKILNRECNETSIVAELHRDRNTSIGIASGYVNLIAAFLGYKSGYCACFNNTEICEILGMKEDCVLLLGVGFDTDAKATQHHLDLGIVYPNKPKEPIEIIVH